MPSFRFVHAADLHIDSPFRGLFSSTPDHAEILRQATFDAYDRLIDFCLDQDVDGLLVAGDVFDSAEPNLTAELKFQDGLIRLAERGIRSFVSHGNHDPLDGWRAGLRWPQEAHRFGSEPQSVPLRENDPASPIVYGVSYPTREIRDSLVPLFPAPDPVRPAIGLMHANVGSNTGHQSYAPCTIEDLVSTGYDYWALGHVHTRDVLRSPERGAPVIVYPGNLQGRHPNESGARGAYLVEMDEKGTVTDLKFQPLDVVRWETLELAIDAFEDVQDLIDALNSKVIEVLETADGRHLVYGIRLSGRGVVHAALSRKGFLSDIQAQLNDRIASQRPFALCERINDATAISFDRDEVARGGDFVADLLAVIDEVRADPSELRRLAEDAGLADLYEHGRARRYLAEAIPDEPALARLVEDAERLLLDGLMEGES